MSFSTPPPGNVLELQRAGGCEEVEHQTQGGVLRVTDALNMTIQQNNEDRSVLRSIKHQIFLQKVFYLLKHYRATNWDFLQLQVSETVLD